MLVRSTHPLMRMAKKSGFYWVAKGFKPGIYASWDEAKVQVERFSGAAFAKVPDLETAIEQMQQRGAAAHIDGGSVKSTASATAHSSASVGVQVAHQRPASSSYAYGTDNARPSSSLANAVMGGQPSQQFAYPAAAASASSMPAVGNRRPRAEVEEDDDEEVQIVDDVHGRRVRPNVPGAVPGLSSNSSSGAGPSASASSSSSATLTSPSECTWLLRFDGGARSNPGPAGSGSVLYLLQPGWESASGEVGADISRQLDASARRGGKYESNLHVETKAAPMPTSALTKVWSFGYYLGDKESNNQAEYTGLIIGLQAAHRFGVKRLIIEGDSLLVCNQVRGGWKVSKESSHLEPLRDAARKHLNAAKFSAVTLRHIAREGNADADAAGNEAMDGRRAVNVVSDAVRSGHTELKPADFCPLATGFVPVLDPLRKKW